jgi:hypothetical protein
MEESEIEKIARECRVKILRWRNRQLIADMSNIHLNTLSRFLSGGELTVSNLIAIELAVAKYQRIIEYKNLCYTCE